MLCPIECLAQQLTLRTNTLVWRPNGLGGESGVAPPVPMPNTAVKRSSANDTRVIKPWENRPVPGPLGRHMSWFFTYRWDILISYRRGVEQW
jgi:hypothetical protein